MLDAAHGAGYCAIAAIQRIDVRRIETEEARIVIAGGTGRGRPRIAVRADVRQGSRVVEADARSRRSEQSLGWMPGRTVNE